MKASYSKHILNFKEPSGTSRGILRQKETWFLTLEEGERWGIGECGLLKGLSCDDRPDYEDQLKWVCEHIHLGKDVLYQEMRAFPSIQMGIETAFISLISEDPFILFPSKFTESEDTLPINGLIWMGDQSFMMDQLEQKLAAGFKCIKMKVGAIDFKKELAVLKSIRQRFSKNEIKLRVDANGAFTPKEALSRLEDLAVFEIHSIEQPIKPGQWKAMAFLCENSPIPIALDEELIGVFDSDKKKSLLDSIKPQFIILKPSFIGGFEGSQEWINLAQKQNVGWWITSALESNVGLNAISQWTYTLNPNGPQGLGTGSLFTNNVDSPLEVKNGFIAYNNSKIWNKIN
ncbi:MAG: o-succinylbenzoate synthase [Flavobacteriaceae bacterium]